MNISKIYRYIKSTVREELYYIQYLITGNDYRLDIDIMSIDDTLQYMSIPGHSIVRFGDGEFYVIQGGDIGQYQEADPVLSSRLDEILRTNKDSLLVCLPEPICGVSNYRKISKKHWILHNKDSRNKYLNMIDTRRVYGNSFVSRPYMIYEDKSQCRRWFDSFKTILCNRDVVIIEGIFSRTGVGNDLLSQAKTVKRILCPPNNAFKLYNLILQTSMAIDKGCLILIALGPAGKVLTYDLAKAGYWALDIGHIDSEYEWFNMKASDKKRITNKHSAEHHDSEIGDCLDPEYMKSIMCRIE